MNIPRTLGACLAAASLSAQNPIAFPQDTTSTLSGTVSPLGFTRTGHSDEGRLQQLVPARYLPSKSTVITGLDVFTLVGAGPVTYRSLKITLAHTNRASLSSVFATNLTSPVLVLDEINFGVRYQIPGWTRIDFTTPFIHDGIRNLVIEFQKVVDGSAHTMHVVAHGNTFNPPRNDLPSSVHTFGDGSSGASTSRIAAHGFFALCLRLNVLTSTVTLRSDRGGAIGQVFALNTSFEVTNHGIAGRAFANAFSVGFGRGFPLFGSVVHLNTPHLMLNFGTIGASGKSTQKVPIPGSASLVGTRIVIQGVTSGTGAPIVTNATDLIVNQ